MSDQDHITQHQAYAKSQYEKKDQNNKEVMYRIYADAVDRVFQQGAHDAPAILPDFVTWGDSKLEAVIRLAIEYKRIKQEVDALRAEVKRLAQEGAQLRKGGVRLCQECDSMRKRIAEWLNASTGTKEQPEVPDEPPGKWTPATLHDSVCLSPKGPAEADVDPPTIRANVDPLLCWCHAPTPSDDDPKRCKRCGRLFVLPR